MPVKMWDVQLQAQMGQQMEQQMMWCSSPPCCMRTRFAAVPHGGTRASQH
jgi:hypothetical protein